MDNDTLGKAVFIIELKDSEAKKQLSQWRSNLDKTMSDGSKSTKTLSNGFDDLKASVVSLAGAAASFTVLTSGVKAATNAYNQFQASMNGVKAVAVATGNDIATSLQAIQDVTANGLLTESDAAAAMKNLQLYGYSIQEATEMIKIMTDAAVYNRQANYGVSESVRVTTEGIRMENSILSDASGVTKNIAKMHEEYAKQLGKATTQLTAAEKAQAVYNGYLAEGGVFAGNAEEYTRTLAGAQQQLEIAMTKVKQSIGATFSTFAPMISGLATWLNQNKELVAGLTMFVGILVGGYGVVKALKLAAAAITAVKAALIGMATWQKVATLGFIGLAAVIATLAVTASIEQQMQDMSAAGYDVSDSAGLAGDSIAGMGESAEDAAKKIAKLEAQLAKLERDYLRDLKQIAVNHEENLKRLNQQIEEANIDYKRAIEERVADFNVTLAEQERSHQETVDELMTQLNFLQRYNNDYNKQKLAQVEFALAKEQSLYQRETEALQEQIDLQNQADKEKLDAKLAALQAELDDEIAFMEKHRQDLNSVRDVILLDEIESLRERYEEQKASYKQQIAEAGNAGAAIGQNLADQINDALKNNEYKIGNLGKSAGEQFSWGLSGALSDGGKVIDGWIENLQKRFYNLFSGNGFTTDEYTWVNGVKVKVGTSTKSGGWATGGYTGRGNPDEIAGYVHKGEYVIPAEQVDQQSGLPKMGTTQNITINLTGVLATSAQAKRDLAMEIQKAIAQTNQARLTA